MNADAIRLTDVRFRWHPREPQVIDIPNLIVAAGERVLIQGPSGSGKTTLLNLLAGVAVPEAGLVSVLGADLAAQPASHRDSFRADHIGFIFQMFNLVPYLSLIDNVALPCRFSAARRQAVLRSADSVPQEAARLLRHMGLDVDALGRRSVAGLSVGQQQRVAAARALIGTPQLVIADEPTSALDSETRQAFLELLFREVAGADATLVFVSHDAGLGAFFDRTIAFTEINRAPAE